jgi:Domain of unknown function (DUF4832)/Domain of unknown function (DUF4874)
MNRYTFYMGTIGWISMLLVGCKSNNDLAHSDSAPDRTVAAPTVALAVATAKPAFRSKLIITYPPTLAEFPNPERGFHNDINLISDLDFSATRRKGYSLSRAYVRLDQYRNRPLPPELLAKLDRQFQLVRKAGIKVILRFNYNFPTGETDMIKAPDASLDLTLAHINQLKPLLQRNADVISVLQGGFIGAWGEWHNSGNGLDRPQPKAKILAALLTALPNNRMVQMRYPQDIKSSYPQPLTSANAFRGIPQSRVGFKNDCFLSNPSDAGTYEPDLPGLKNYASQIAPFIPVGGETCSATPSQQRTDCPSAQAELGKFHWSYLNVTFYEPALDRWREEGCYAEIARSLGYRFQLVRSSFPATLPRKGQLKGNFVIQNIGYASPFNPRNLELILRARQTSKIYHIPILKPLSKTHDPRFWQPQAGQISVDVRTKIPSNLPAGEYELLLNLPDPMPKLATRPEYSIRLANEQIWEVNTGFNSLQRTVKILK